MSLSYGTLVLLFIYSFLFIGDLYILCIYCIYYYLCSIIYPYLCLTSYFLINVGLWNRRLCYGLTFILQDMWWHMVFEESCGLYSAFLYALILGKFRFLFCLLCRIVFSSQLWILVIIVVFISYFVHVVLLFIYFILYLI